MNTSFDLYTYQQFLQDLPESVTTKRLYGKRFFDLIFSLCVLTLGAPIYLLLALLIKISSKGPVFFTQTRVGSKGKLFKAYKFRTMRLDAETLLKNVLQEKPHLLEEWKSYRKLKKDPRITWIGTFLRKTSLDELPQFFNVLKGDLSVVGPRPISPEEVVQYYQKDAMIILSVPQGITGMWQTSGRNSLSMKKRIELEKNYVKNRSFLLDLYLVLKTIPSMIFSKGAY